MERVNRNGEETWRVAVVSDEWEPLQPLLACLQAQPDIETVDTFDQVSLPAKIPVFRGVFMYVHRTLRPEVCRALIDYTRRGGRMIIAHHGIASSKTRSPEWLEFTGIRIAPRDDRGRPWRVIGETTHTLINVRPGHYITSYRVRYDAKDPFQISPDAPARTLPVLRFPDTEVFVNQQHAPGRSKTILFVSRCMDPESGREIVLPGTGWLERIDAGWLFYFQPGHRVEDFLHPAYQQILLNCLTWNP